MPASDIDGHGLDLSHHNVDGMPPYNWAAVKADGIEFVSVKLTEGTYYRDPQAGSLVAGARSVGLPVGGYHFARLANSNGSRPTAEQQADYFLAQASNLGLLGAGSFLPMLDMEDASLRGSCNDFTRRFIARVRAMSGVRKVAVYASMDWWKNSPKLDPAQWADGDVFLWVARYNGDPGNAGYSHPQVALHQHTSSGSVPGVPDPTIDKNVVYNGHTVARLVLGSISTPEQQEDYEMAHVTIPAHVTERNADGTPVDPNKEWGGKVIALPPQNGDTEVSKVWLTLVADNTDVEINVAHFQCRRRSDGAHYWEDMIGDDGQPVREILARQEHVALAPPEAYSLILNYRMAEPYDAAVMIEAKR